MTGKTRLRSPGFLARFRAQTRGATAVEFALIATPFFALLMGIMELGLVFLASVSLDNSVQSASRQIRTGQLISPGSTAAKEVSRQAFRTTICEGMRWMVDNCKNNLVLDVRPFTSFSNISVGDPVGGGTVSIAGMTFDTGAGCDIVLIRAYYRWKLYSPIINKAMERGITGETLLNSVTTFRNEPYGNTTC